MAVKLVFGLFFIGLCIFRAKIGQKGPTFEEFFHYAVDYRISWQKRGFDTPLLNRIIFKKIQRSFGGQLKVMVYVLCF